MAAVFIKDFDNSEKLYYIHSDYLGSVMALTNESGVKVEEYFYNAWGQRRNPNDWTQNDTRTNLIVDRGYTGHEHLDHFDLINMNGRVYDPGLGRFLSSDPIMQVMDYSQNFNKFSYVYNNPFVFSDPTGEFAFALVIIAAWYGGMQGLNQVGRSNHHAIWQDFAKGWLIGSSIGAGAGAAGVGGSYIVSVGWSAAYGAACGATTGAYNALAFDGNVATSALYGGLIGGFTGLISGLQNYEFQQKIKSLNRKLEVAVERFPANSDGTLDPSNETLEEFSDEVYGDFIYEEKAKNIYDNETVLAKGKADGKEYGAFSDFKNPNADGTYNIRYSTSSFSSKRQLYFDMGHEYVHLANKIELGANFNSRLSEYSAYYWNYKLTNNLTYFDMANNPNNGGINLQTLKGKAYLKTYVKPNYMKYNQWKLWYKYPKGF